MMDVLVALMYTAVVIIAVLLIALILVQPSKGGGLGSAFAGIGESVFGAHTMAQSTADFVNKLEIALKECYETDYWLEILFKVGSMDENTYKILANKNGAIRRKLIASITTAKENV